MWLIHYVRHASFVTKQRKMKESRYFQTGDDNCVRIVGLQFDMSKNLNCPWHSVQNTLGLHLLGRPAVRLITVWW
jgi:hypothetical protein